MAPEASSFATNWTEQSPRKTQWVLETVRISFMVFSRAASCLRIFSSSSAFDTAITFSRITPVTLFLLCHWASTVTESGLHGQLRWTTKHPWSLCLIIWQESQHKFEKNENGFSLAAHRNLNVAANLSEPNLNVINSIRRDFEPKQTSETFGQSFAARRDWQLSIRIIMRSLRKVDEVQQCQVREDDD